MQRNGHNNDYEPVGPLRGLTGSLRDDAPLGVSRPAAATRPAPHAVSGGGNGSAGARPLSETTRPAAPAGVPLKRGHALGFAGLFLFTTLLYFRPYELFPSLAWLANVPFWVAAATVLVFVPAQVGLEGTLTARPREVVWVLLFCVAVLLSVPLAIDPGEAWDTFSGLFLKVVTMFVVFVNVVRTEGRLRLMILLALAAGFVISFSAINSYLSGNFSVEGYRVEGGIRGSGLFGGANDMALYLVTLIPIAVALFCRARNVLLKAGYGALILLMLAGTLVTYSRGGFLGLSAAVLVLAWKLGRRHRLAVVIALVLCVAAFLALAPQNYGDRLASITSSGPNGEASAMQRRAILSRSILVALQHPLFGVGMGNFHIVSYQNLVTHNAYTQVAAETGLTALALYLMFMLTPLKRMREMERETRAVPEERRAYYLAVGLQASLAGYMVSSFFLAVAYGWTVYYLVGYAVCLRRLYESGRAAESGAGASAVLAAQDPAAGGDAHEYAHG